MKKTFQLGYNLSSEEHAPNDLVKNAQHAEKIGFDFAMISDHYHPWMDIQGHSSFVWSVIGAISHATELMHLATGVTCPIMRIHPAIIAQAAATAADMMPGRFSLGIGSGENLNEHILGDHWPPTPTRLEMMEEAVAIIRKLWTGDEITHYGKYYTVENARIYTLPEKLPPILIASSAENSAELAGKIGDGLVSTAPLKEIIENFEQGGGKNKPRYGKLDVCWASTEKEGRRIAYQQWANTGIEGQLNQEIATPALMEMAAAMVSEEDVTKHIICGPDPEKHLAQIRKYEQAGFDHIYIHQIGPDQDGFFKFYEKEILPRLS
ncbi:MAG: TIGR03557 family F420-dependent LLM class oxidoreductase [Anaerolineaceae bacterium]|jgi:G6PDH family F420-dependent oxidoreductase|nr:TIGR03557 family F420-dependent LLM class oxidoreductase [Anaerolineaceae bacterium]